MYLNGLQAHPGWAGRKKSESKRADRMAWLFIHEFGHVLSLGHANLDTMDDYGDLSSQMGISPYINVCYNLPQQHYLGWHSPLQLSTSDLPMGKSKTVLLADMYRNPTNGYLFKHDDWPNDFQVKHEDGKMEAVKQDLYVSFVSYDGVGNGNNSSPLYFGWDAEWDSKVYVHSAPSDTSNNNHYTYGKPTAVLVSSTLSIQSLAP